MCGIGEVNLKVAIVDSDRYALNAINAYLAWDRRTRVKIKADDIEDFWRQLSRLSRPDYPDALVLDANHVGGDDALFRLLGELRDAIPHLMVVCMAQFVDMNLLYAAVDAGARAFLLKGDVRLHIGWSLYYTEIVDRGCFLVSRGLLEACDRLHHAGLRRLKALPGPRVYPGLTKRLQQAIVLFAIEGMPQRLVADEMGISETTVRDYIKKAYRILESHQDDCEYPDDMSPQEVAFMRVTALDSIAVEC